MKFNETQFKKGIEVFRCIVEQNTSIWPIEIVLHDGDTISILPEDARGVLRLCDSLAEDNRCQCESLDVLGLLHILEEALKAGILRREGLRVSPEARKLYEQKFLGKGK